MRNAYYRQVSRPRSKILENDGGWASDVDQMYGVQSNSTVQWTASKRNAGWSDRKEEDGATRLWSTPHSDHHISSSSSSSTSRRNFGVSSLVAVTTTLLSPFVPAASCLADGDGFNFEARDRKGNKEAVIRDDYWYIFGRTPPRQLRAPLVGSDPQWNTFGSCESSESSGTNFLHVRLTQSTHSGLHQVRLVDFLWRQGVSAARCYPSKHKSGYDY